MRAADKPVGPRQKPLEETITLAERTTDIEGSRESKRVNPLNHRAYALDGYEKVCVCVCVCVCVEHHNRCVFCLFLFLFSEKKRRKSETQQLTVLFFL